MDGLLTFEINDILGVENQPFVPRQMPEDQIEKSAGDFFDNFFERLSLGLDKAEGMSESSWDEPLVKVERQEREHSLSKRASDGPRIEVLKTTDGGRIEREFYLSGKGFVEAVFDARGVCTSTRIVKD